MSITSQINSALIKGEKNIVINGGEHQVNNAFICVNSKNVSLVGNGCSIVGKGNVLQIKNAEDVAVDEFAFTSTEKKDFTVNVSKSKNVTFTRCKFSSVTSCVVISDCDNVVIKDCEFVGDKGNGVCILNASMVRIENCSFSLSYGEGVTVVENKDGVVTIHNNSFKRCHLALKSLGQNSIKITNNYFLTYSSALKFLPSVSLGEMNGAQKVEIRYNLFDECCKDEGIATVVIAGYDESYSHRQISLLENIFSQSKRAVIHAKGVKCLTFKENSVKTNDESTVENSIINGIKA